MTLAELHERIGWQLKGTLQWRDGRDNWNQWNERRYVPSITDSASDYHERPQPTLPDEVWIAEYQGFQFNSVLGAHKTREHCASGNDGATPIRYIRADGVIGGARLEWLCNTPSGSCWVSGSSLQFRFV